MEPMQDPPLPLPPEDITLTDWFAGQALAGIITRHGCFGGEAELVLDLTAAQWAYEYADAMMYERDKRNNPQ